MHLDATSYQAACDLALSWADTDRGHYVCVANVHMAIVGRNDATYRSIVNHADLVTPDGMPLVWMLQLLGVRRAVRVYGPTLMLHLCEVAAERGVPVGFYGATTDTLDVLEDRLTRRFPSLQVAYRHAPPFRASTPDEDDAVVEDIVASGARILFVGLGCPKQERWMANHRDRLPLVQIGVGAAFDFHAGRVRQAPGWLQRLGLEWLFRLLMEPRRLWKRYLATNPRFVLLAAMQLLHLRKFG